MDTPVNNYYSNLAQTVQETATESYRIHTNYENVPQPYDSESNKIRNIQIEQLHSGYIIKVGCHSFAVEEHTTLITKLAAYLSNPQEVEKKWFETKKL